MLPDAPLTLTVEQAGRLLGISRGLAYEAARTGDLPTLRIGRRLLVPRHQLERLLGTDLPVNGSKGGEAMDQHPGRPESANGQGNVHEALE